ncbi:MarR family winged helix-turn-helix transcriptional regulator [Nonomuraea pusilla]|uniref:MarR family winged helix-turn-helix transcriptional regulator n=1 Tax=Nonomuraea pusilla TaxID=46177 RepID=UPI0033329271
MPGKGLSLPEFSALVVLAVEGREVSNRELKESRGITIDGVRRRRLNEMKLVESVRRGRAYTHELTDAGWARLAEDLRAGELPRQSGSSGVLAAALLGWLRGYMERTGRPLADVFQPDDAHGGPQEVAAQEAAHGGPQDAAAQEAASGVEARIRDAYARLAARPGAWVSLAALRPLLADVPRADVDGALVRMERLSDVNLVPESNQKTLTPREREAAVTIGEQAKHLLWIGPR